MMRHALAVLAALACTGAAPGPPVQFLAPAGAPGPFSSAVRIGNMVYVSGAIGVGPDGTLPAEFTAQAGNAMRNVADELKLAGASMDDVFKCDVSLADMKNWPAFNIVYLTYFKAGHLPVRMASGANGLAKGAAVELECQAYLAR